MKTRKTVQPILTIEGKAKHVFKYLALVARYKGNVTLKELSQNLRKRPK